MTDRATRTGAASAIAIVLLSSACSATDDTTLAAPASQAPPSSSPSPPSSTSNEPDGPTPIGDGDAPDASDPRSTEVIEVENGDLTGDVVRYDDSYRYAFVEASESLPWEQVESIFVAYDDFLARSEAVWLNGEAGDPELAEAGLVDLPLRAHEASQASDVDAFEDVLVTSNIIAITGSVESGVVVEDCTEVSITNSLFIVSPDFVRQNVHLEATDDGGWTVTDVDVVHDGRLASAHTLGCVPGIYAQQAELTVTEFLRLEAGPTASELDGVIVETLGHSVLAGPRTIYVAVCRPDPDGAPDRFVVREYEVTRGLAEGFPDTGTGRDVYAVSDRSPIEPTDDCPAEGRS